MINILSVDTKVITVYPKTHKITIQITEQHPMLNKLLRTYKYKDTFNGFTFKTMVSPYVYTHTREFFVRGSSTEYDNRVMNIYYTNKSYANKIKQKIDIAVEELNLYYNEIVKNSILDIKKSIKYKEGENID